MGEIWENMLFGIFLTCITYFIGVKINKKLKTPWTNPLLLAILFSWCILKGLHIDYEDYMQGGQIINMLITPATAAVGLSIYRQIDVLKKDFFPIMAGSFGACICSLGTVEILGKVFGLDKIIVISMLPKSITTAIALDISAQMGGLKVVTMMAVVMTGVLGAVINPMILKALKLRDPVATGVCMGSTSHAAGAAKAMEMGEVEGAVAGVCIGTSGLLTVLIAVFL